MIDLEMQELKQKWQQVLYNRNYDYTEYATEEIFSQFLERKGKLIELFSKHPKWNPEKLMIQFDTTIERKIDTSTIRRFITIFLDSEIKKQLGLELYQALPIKEQKITDFIFNIETQFFSPDMDKFIEEVNEQNKNFMLRNNMKSSKAIGKICREMGWDKFENYNKEYAKLCDALNPIKVTRHTCLSLNPLDFLLMSNGSSWTSCHYIDNCYEDPGCYSSGTISYMLDSTSFVFYTVDAEYDGDEIELEKKIQRQIFAYNDECILQSRLYPQANDYGAEAIYTDFRNVVQKIIADCLNKPNLWVKSKSDVGEVVQHGYEATCYPDWRYGDLCSISTLKDRTSTLQRKIVVGSKPICIECGNSHSIERNISCCYSCYSCNSCGEGLSESEARFDRWGNPYCEDCSIYCEHCDYYVPRSNSIYIEGIQDHVCEECADRFYYSCEWCGEYHNKDEMTVTKEGEVFCENCSERWFVCDECGFLHSVEYQYTLEDDVYNGKYCEKCFDEIVEKLEAEEEEETENEAV